MTQSPLLLSLDVSIQHANYPVHLLKEFLQSLLDPSTSLANYHVPCTRAMRPHNDHFVDSVQQ